MLKNLIGRLLNLEIRCRSDWLIFQKMDLTEIRRAQTFVGLEMFQLLEDLGVGIGLVSMNSIKDILELAKAPDATDDTKYKVQQYVELRNNFNRLCKLTK